MSTLSAVVRPLVILLLFAPLIGGCVSKSKYQVLEQQRDELSRQVAELQTENSVLTDTLNTRQMKSIGSLEDRLRDCKAFIEDTKVACAQRVEQAEETGYFRGAADFNASLQVAGFPHTDGWWIFSTHYYEFQVRLKDEILFSQVVETEHKQPPIQQGLALVQELTNLMRLAG